jgi:quercetin dioxygenase-like cupin family protein
MQKIDRRSALALGVATSSAVIVTGSAAAQPYGATEGREIAPGVRVVQLGERESMVPGYKTVSMRDFVYQPKSKSAGANPMANDMVCHCPEGELRVTQNSGQAFTVKKGDVWSCNKGLREEVENIGSGVSIMRVINLLPT